MGKFDEEVVESEEQKKAKILASRKKRNTNIFLFGAVIFQVAETFILMCAAFLLFIFITYRILKVPGDSSTGNTVTAIMSIVILVGGLIGGFRIYVTVVRWFIKKFNMEDKLTKEVLDRYKKEEPKEY